MILYELLTGRKPFKGDTMPSLMFAIMKDEPTQPSAVDTNVAPVWDAILKQGPRQEPRRALRDGEGVRRRRSGTPRLR